MFNKLSAKEIELLAGTAEECGEVVQVIGKTLRHGFDSVKPGDPSYMTNYNKLVMELADVVAMVEMLEEQGVLDLTQFEELKHQKKLRFYQYAHHVTPV